MDKVKGSTQSMPLWDRQKSGRGHYSSVDKALQAHRQRNTERQARVEERLNIVRNMSNDFFPTPHAHERPELMDDSFQTAPALNPEISNQPINMASTQMMPELAMSESMEVPEMEAFNPMEVDEIYSEASMMGVTDNALGIVQKEMANPEEAPTDEIPKGSYVDYTV